MGKTTAQVGVTLYIYIIFLLSEQLLVLADEEAVGVVGGGEAGRGEERSSRPPDPL